MAERNRLHPVQRALVYGALLALVATGLLWEADVARALLMKIHGAAAMATLVLLGVLIARHVPSGWSAARANRLSGALLLATSLWLTMTGYLLYYSGSESLRDYASQTHFWVGVAFAAVFALHQVRVRPG
jgi:hypothetical protein